MNANVADNSDSRARWWAKVLRSLGIAGGVAAASTVASLVTAEQASYRSAATAPASWQNLATELKTRFEERLAADSEVARRMRDAVTQFEQQSPLMLIVRAWIAPTGKVERLEFDGLDDAEIAIELRALLAVVTVGPPPSEMLQPLHLRLSLRLDHHQHKDP